LQPKPAKEAQRLVPFSVPFAVAVVLALAAALVFIDKLGSDEFLSKQFAMAIGATVSGNHDAPAILFGYLLFATLETYIAFRLPNPDRILATICMFTLTVLYQWALARLFHVSPHPFGYIIILCAGFLAGLYLRWQHTQQQIAQATYYQMKVKDRELLEMRLTLLKHDEVERRTLAADLHDQVLNDLKQIAQRFDHFAEKPEPEEADAIRRLTSQVMTEIRDVMDSLSPAVLEHLGLPPAIEDCLRRGAQRAGFKIRFRSSVEAEDLKTLSQVEQGLLYRLVQESITNICKHAAASLVRINIAVEGDSMLSIRVIDDGKGMDFDNAEANSRGVKYMRYRADLIGASVTWGPGEGNKGTMVEIRMDLTPRQTATVPAQNNQARNS
jgi:signal transduction histidine kinase